MPAYLLAIKVLHDQDKLEVYSNVSKNQSIISQRQKKMGKIKKNKGKLNRIKLIFANLNARHVHT